MNPATVSKLLLRPEEAAEALSVSRAKVYGLLREGKLESIKIGRSRRIPVDALARCVAAYAVPRDRRRTTGPVDLLPVERGEIGA